MQLLLEVGILGNLNDMTSETAFIKLSWLLSNYSKKEAKTLISENFKFYREGVEC